MNAPAATANLPDSFYDKLLRKRYAAAVRARGLCTFCACRAMTSGGSHCRGDEGRQMGMCIDDGRLPQFRLDDETLKELRDTRPGEVAPP